jgi:single-strand DNA-binding protein
MNKVILTGNLTKDSELKFLPGSGVAVAKFTLAVQKRKKEDGADFIHCVWFGKGAESMAQYLVKGAKVGIVGRINTGSYEAKDGHKVYTTDVIVEELEVLKWANSNSENVNNSADITPVDGGEIPF